MVFHKEETKTVKTVNKRDCNTTVAGRVFLISPFIKQKRAKNNYKSERIELEAVACTSHERAPLTCRAHIRHKEQRQSAS
jgi:hypothetical protein